MEKDVSYWKERKSWFDQGTIKGKGGRKVLSKRTALITQILWNLTVNGYIYIYYT